MSNTHRIAVWTAITALFTLAMCQLQGIRLIWGEIYATGLLGSFFLTASYLARRTWAGPFFWAMAAMNFFTTWFALGMNVVATTAMPQADSALALLDYGVGVSVFQFCKEHPYLDAILLGVYRSIGWQSFIVVLFLAGTRRADQLTAFVMYFILGALVMLAIFYVTPSEGTQTLGLPLPEHARGIPVMFHQLREGVTELSLLKTEGVVSFPSFHTIWAIILVAAYRGTFLYVPMAIINAVMLVSTMTAGMHYGLDVLAGALIAFLVIRAVDSLARKESDCPPAQKAGQKVSS